jgi:hypothetical protein
VFRPILAEVGMTPRDGDSHLVTMTRALCVDQLVAGADEVCDRFPVWGWVRTDE